MAASGHAEGARGWLSRGLLLADKGGSPFSLFLFVSLCFLFSLFFLLIPFFAFFYFLFFSLFPVSPIFVLFFSPFVLPLFPSVFPRVSSCFPFFHRFSPFLPFPLCFSSFHPFFQRFFTFFPLVSPLCSSFFPPIATFFYPFPPTPFFSFFSQCFFFLLSIFLFSPFFLFFFGFFINVFSFFSPFCWRTDRGAQQTTTTRHDNNHSTCNNASKSWRSDAPIILPGWEHHTGGSRSLSTSTSVPGTPGRLSVAHSTVLNRCSIEPNSPTWLRNNGCDSFTIPQNCSQDAPR